MKFWVKVLAVGMIVFSFAATANAQNTNQNEIPLEKKQYDFREDPFLLAWTFHIEKNPVEETLVETAMSPEEKILNRWKAKQTQKWATLPKGKFIVNASAYTAAADECGKNDGITSSGLKVEEGRTLACPAEFPFGAKIYIEGIGERRCEDRGGAIKGNKVDIYMETKQDAFAFGRRNLEAYVVE